MILILVSYLIFPLKTGNFLAEKSILYNPASVSGTHASAVYGEVYSVFNYYSLSLNYKMLGFGMETLKSGDFYLNSITTGYTFKYSEKINFGVTAELIQMFALGEEGMSNSFKLNAGVTLKDKKRVFGISAFNLLSTTRELYSDGQIVFSSAANVTPDLHVYFDAIFEEGKNVSYVIGSSFKFSRFASIYAGFGTNPPSYHISLELEKYVKFSYFINIHPYLGLSQFIGISR